MEQKHSPLPFCIEPIYPNQDFGGFYIMSGGINGTAIAEVDSESLGDLPIDQANASFIVTACNSHYELLEALTEFAMISEIGLGYHCGMIDGRNQNSTTLQAIINKAKSAIQKATGGE